MLRAGAGATAREVGGARQLGFRADQLHSHLSNSAGSWQHDLTCQRSGKPIPHAWVLAHTRALKHTKSTRDQGGHSRRTGGREEERVDGVVAAAAAAQLHAPAGLQAVQVREARTPRREALRHARDRPRRVQHLRAGQRLVLG